MNCFFMFCQMQDWGAGAARSRMFWPLGAGAGAA